MVVQSPVTAEKMMSSVLLISAGYLQAWKLAGDPALLTSDDPSLESQASLKKKLKFSNCALCLNSSTVQRGISKNSSCLDMAEMLTLNRGLENVNQIRF